MEQAIINDIIIVFILKSLDCIFGTMKSIYLYKNKYFLSSTFSMLSTLFYFIAVVKAAVTNNPYVIGTVAIATLIGSYLPAKIMDMLEKDKVFIYDITSDTMESGKEFADTLREYNLPIRTMKVYNSQMEKVLNCKVYSDSKTTSKLIEDSIPETFKFSVITSRFGE
jgi:uncharacterized protein YebE (UPF0316 family)